MLGRRRPLFDVTRAFTAADLAQLRNHLASPSRQHDPASRVVFGRHMERWRGAQAAVGLCLCNVQKNDLRTNRDVIAPSILLTVRGSHLRQHAGECSLPGGKVDPEDQNDPSITFLRELHEEVGVDYKSTNHSDNHVEILGQLDAVRSSSGLDISVFVAFISGSSPQETSVQSTNSLAPLSINSLRPLPQFQSEVAHIFSLSFESLLDSQRHRQAYFRQNPDFPYNAIDVSPETSYFTEAGRPGRPSEFKGLELWGLSGWIVSSFLKITLAQE